MSDLLNVTTPIAPKNYDLTNREAQQTQTDRNFNLADTSKINKTNERNEEYLSHDNKDGSGTSLSVSSGVSKNPTAASGVLRAIVGSDTMRSLAASGNSAVLNKVTEFANEVMLKPSSLADDMLRQESDSTVYSGELWGEMKNILLSSSSTDVADAVISFAKAASDAASRDSILSSISSELGFLASETAQSQALVDQLNEVAGKLSNENFSQLMGTIQNLLSSVKDSLLLDDSSKNLISLITYNLSRYNGSSTSLGESFNAVLDMAASSEQADMLRDLFIQYIENSGFPDDIRLSALQNLAAGTDSPQSALTLLAEKLGAQLNSDSGRLSPALLSHLLDGIDLDGGTASIGKVFSSILGNSSMNGALNNILRSYDSTGNISALLDRLSIMINSVDNQDNKSIIAAKVNEILSHFDAEQLEIPTESISASRSVTLISKELGSALDATINGITPERLSRMLSGLDTSQGSASLRAILSPLLPDASQSNLSTLLRSFNSSGDLNRLIDDLGIMINSVRDTDKKIILAQSLNEVLGNLSTANGVNYKPPTSMSNLFDFLAKNLNDPSLKSLSSMSRSDIMQGLLTAPGVYTPLLHYLVPINDGGTKAFGELWVDPDAEQKNGSKSANHLFLCFEIEETGYFELELSAQDNSLQVQLLCPAGTERQFSPLKDSLPQLATANGYSINSAKIGTVVKKRDLTQVFPKIKDKRGGLNVKI